MLWAGPIEFSGPELVVIFLAVVVLPLLVMAGIAFVIFRVGRRLLRDRAGSKRRRAETDAKPDEVPGKEPDPPARGPRS
jgi:hypothetical protein